MAKQTFVIDPEKLRRDLARVSKMSADKAIRSLTRNDLLDVADATIDEMKTMISKGISPIKGEGRFPAYLWAGKKSLARKRGAKKKALNREFSDKYPYSAMKKFPGKKERPVNLKLSGDFLNALSARVGKSRIDIGFFDKPFEDYELGHREGANGQPKRPIIPIKGEELSPSIYRRLVKTLQKVFDKKRIKA